jgi:hypothetical protein
MTKQLYFTNIISAFTFSSALLVTTVGTELGYF